MQGHKRSAVKVDGELQERMTAVKLRAEHVMAGIITAVSKEFNARPRHLTETVQKVFAEAPSHLEWSSCTDLTGCWVAEVQEKRGLLSRASRHMHHEVYTVNLLTGAALRNGKAPTHLDREVLEHRDYVAVFENTDFDVTPQMIGDQVIYRTVHAINGCFYSWQLFDSRLHVTETSEDETLELLPCTDLPT